MVQQLPKQAYLGRNVCRWARFILLGTLLLLPLLAQKDSTKGTAGTNNTPADAVHDVMTTSFPSADATNLGLTTKEQETALRAELEAIDKSAPLKEWSTKPLAKAIQNQCPVDCAPATGTGGIGKSGIAYVFHIVTWSKPKADSPTVPVSSDWHVYQLNGKDTLKSAGFVSDGNPRIYNKQQVLIVGVARFKEDATKDDGLVRTIVDAYKSSATQGQPQNQTDVVALVTAVLGISGGAGAQAQGKGEAFPDGKIFIASGMQAGTAHLPFDVKVSVVSDDHGPARSLSLPAAKKKASANKPAPPATGSPQLAAGGDDSAPDGKGGADKSQAPAEPSPGVMSCAGNDNSVPCTTTRTFTSEDREWWDVSIGIAVPGVRESQYSIVNNALHTSVTRHTDFYGMLDLYPFAFAGPNDSWEPHFNVGIPLTGQSLYRPYFGMAESLGGLLTALFRPQKQIGLPLGLNIFAGMTWMKTHVVIDNPTTAGDLTLDTSTKRVWKPMFGLEVPISSIASKVKSVVGKNSNGSGKSGGGGS
jgi:hypothetical protein